MHYSRKQRQLKNLIKKTNDLVHLNGDLIDSKIIVFKRKIQKLIDELKHLLGVVYLRRALGSLILVLGLNIETSQAQEFGPYIQNTYGITGSSDIDAFIDFDFADLDGDGDYDLVGSKFYFESGDLKEYGAILVYQENIGTATNPIFSPGSTELFAETISGYYELYTYGISSIDIVDIDGDGDFDIVSTQMNIYGYSLAGEYFDEYNAFLFYENTGTPTAPEFNSLSINSLNINLPTLQDGYGGLFCVNFIDIDDDGDFDLFSTTQDYMAGENISSISFCENIGSSIEPEFGEVDNNAFNLPANFISDSSVAVFNVNSVDIDNDGDFDLISSVIDNDDEVSKITFHKNIGTSVSPNFDNLLNTPSGLIQVVDGYVRAKFVDIDGDGDSDAFFLDAYVAALYGQSTVYYQENISSVLIEEVQETIFSIYPNPAAISLTVDLGDLTGLNTTIKLYDSSSKLVFDKQSSSTLLIDVSSYAKGLYTVELSTSGKVLRSQVVIE